VAFADHFSEKSDAYARSRPSYPDTLYAFIASVAPGTQSVWDCATGNGQAAAGLARHFATVEATDASAEQIRNAAAAPNVRYSVQPAERTDFPDGSCDAVCVAQALHWFDLDRFYAEVRRVLKPGGRLEFLDFAGAARSFLAHMLHGRQPLPAEADDKMLRRFRDAGFGQARRLSDRNTMFGRIASYQAIATALTV